MTGIRSLRAVAVLALFAAASAGDVSGQVTVFAGGAVTVPVADFRAIADLGYLASGGGTLELGRPELSVGVVGFYGSNRHRIAGERSDLYGMTVLGGYRVAEAYQFRLSLWAGLGALVHARRSDTFPGLNASKRGLSVSAGAKVSRPLGRVTAFVAGLYTHGLGDLGASSYPTDFITVSGGIAFPLRID